MSVVFVALFRARVHAVHVHAHHPLSLLLFSLLLFCGCGTGELAYWWTQFCSAVSIVEQVLKQDGAGEKQGSATSDEPDTALAHTARETPTSSDA